MSPSQSLGDGTSNMLIDAIGVQTKHAAKLAL